MGYFHKPLTQYSPWDRCETDAKHTSATVKSCGEELDFVFYIYSCFPEMIFFFLLMFVVFFVVVLALCAECTALVNWGP